MATSTSLISGLASGFDWRTMVDQIIAIDHRRVDLVDTEKTALEDKLGEWQTVNSKLLAFRTAADALRNPEDFRIYSAALRSENPSVDASTLLTVSTSTLASPGSYTATVINKAQSQKLASNPFATRTSALGETYAGDIVINGVVIAISADDTLADAADRINSANSGSSPTGVTASIVSYGSYDHRLILTSDATGSEGITLLNGSSKSIVQQFGWKDNQASVVKNAITSGAQSDAYSAPTMAVAALLGLGIGESSSGTLTIGGEAVTIDLAADSLNDIKTAINEAAIPGVQASVITQTVAGETLYRLQIDGTQSFTDENNILNTLGILDHTSAPVSGKVSGNAMTTNGSTITPETLLCDIDGYFSYTEGDHITFSGTDTNDAAVSYDFAISASTTTADLLAALEDAYGDVAAYVTAEGKIRVDDNGGSGVLAVTLEDHISSGTLEFVDGDLAFGAGAARKREIIAGEDAVVEIDGVEVTSASNTLSDVIQGVTLTLAGEDIETTVNLNISHDVEAIQQKIESFVNSYNVIMSYINEQFTYDQEKSEPGGILFGDNTLSSVKSEITSLITGSVWGVNSAFSVLSSLGITMDNDLILSIDENLLGDRIQSNFNDVTAFFVGQGSASGSLLGYVSHGAETQSGAYSVNIQRAAAKASQSGSVDLSAGGAGEVLRISSGSNTATILLTSGMTIDDIVAEINTETASDYAQTIVGDESLYADPGQSSAITATTTWNSLYRSDGSKLLFENGNVISFAGTTRSGAEVEGAYAIENVETDTIQGLLSAVEAAFSSSVVASVDAEGRLVVADKYTGASRLAIDHIWDETETSLFGVIDADEEAGDGSKTGRYALAVTASQDDSGRLVITADDYGRGGITITQDSSDNNYNQIIYSSTRSATVASSGTTDITAETVWSDIIGAGVVDGDTITISGKARDGVTDISGVYAVSDSGVDTVDGLLAAIEAAFAAEGTTVNAFLLDGMITVEDGIAGISLISLSLACNNEGGGSLDFGTVSQSTERDLDLGLINGTYYGLDVAGTIGGEPATGSGQFLRGNDGNVNTAGLSLLYRGSSSNADAGTITITNGMGELFFRTLSYITDSDDGYVTFKQQSLNSSIKGKQERIDEMEAALERKAELMINRFVAMELLLGKLQNQSNWLEGQLSAAYSAWK